MTFLAKFLSSLKVLFFGDEEPRGLKVTLFCLLLFGGVDLSKCPRFSLSTALCLNGQLCDRAV